VSSPPTIFGHHDEKTLQQLRDVGSRAERVALMADGHLGYIMPIGGVAAFDDRVSVAGVGFDIACVAAGEPVVSGYGFHLPIERVGPESMAACWDGSHVRPIDPLLGAVPKGVKATVKLTLTNGRTLRCTPDHRVMTQTGWKAAHTLSEADRIATSPFIGLPWQPSARDVRLVRALGFLNGDGHLNKDGKSVAFYVFTDADAATLLADLRGLGWQPRVYRRVRREGRKPEICIRVNSVALHRQLADLGAPVGKKAWPSYPMPWLLEEPAWVRAQYLSAFGSAEMTTPRVHKNGTLAALQLKQSGDTANAAEFVGRLLKSLGFVVSIAPSGPARGLRQSYVLQLLGGQPEQLRYLEEVGFCYALEKRIAAATACSVAWAGLEYARHRDEAKARARALVAEGKHYRTIIRTVSDAYAVSEGFVYHAIYSDRGSSRRLPGEACTPQTSGEMAWVGVRDLEDDGATDVFDVVTADAAQCFLVNGVAVHNCGNAAIRTDLTLQGIQPDLPKLADAVAATLSFGVGRKNRSSDAPTDHPLFDRDAWGAVPGKRERAALKLKAREQLGTVGSGNHYVDLFADEQERIWVGVHFGSRGFGHTVATNFMGMAAGQRWGEKAKVSEALLDLGSDLGQGYWALMNLAGEYAYVGREWVARKVVALLGGRELELVHNHHNFAWKETHGGRELVVVRKGATPAFPGQRSFVGGSMGDDAVILEGNPDPKTRGLQEAALFSTVHGAGRVMSRTEAAGKWDFRRRVQKAPGKISREMRDAWLRDKGVLLRGGGLDEAPQAYRRLPDVLAAQGDTVRVLHTLRPLVVVMAGEGEVDPYKD
jgi:tRNA-splicing ligase RtcB (3'-phosphate/5'-hydroxy nucleic acid ligase)